MQVIRLIPLTPNRSFKRIARLSGWWPRFAQWPLLFGQALSRIRWKC